MVANAKARILEHRDAVQNLVLVEIAGPGRAPVIQLVSQHIDLDARRPAPTRRFLFEEPLNAAISRAPTLALVLANPKLLELKAKSVEHLRLVNTLAWLSAEAGDGCEQQRRIECAGGNGCRKPTSADQQR